MKRPRIAELNPTEEISRHIVSSSLRAQRPYNIRRFGQCASSRRAHRSKMRREYHRWYSYRMGMDMGVVVYGHWGPPLIGFPTSAGDEWELENQGLVGSLGDLIDGGRVKFFSVNSVN